MSDSQTFSKSHVKELQRLSYQRGQASMAGALINIGAWVRKIDEDSGVSLESGEWASTVEGRLKLVALLREAGVEV